MRAVIDGIAARMAPENPLAVRVRALSDLTPMAGTPQLSRALADRQLADELLEQGTHNAPMLLGVEQLGRRLASHRTATRSGSRSTPALSPGPRRRLRRQSAEPGALICLLIA
ncbi:hypothetical protein ACWD7C_19450 [Streptomyces sp. NPDC005134]|uniref:hypothetical protein n=1 Tax=Streptomyces sp. NPDC005098 TaxID=3154560 RepID=UPI0033BA4752